MFISCAGRAFTTGGEDPTVSEESQKKPQATFCKNREGFGSFFFYLFSFSLLLPSACVL